jgi:hypothetical protein
MKGAGREMTNAHKIFVEEPRDTRQLETDMPESEDKTKMDFKEIR